MGIEYARVGARGQILIPREIRRKYKIRRGTQVAFSEERGRICLHAITDEFIGATKGILAGRGLPADIEPCVDRELDK